MYGSFVHYFLSITILGFEAIFKDEIAIYVTGK